MRLIEPGAAGWRLALYRRYTAGRGRGEAVMASGGLRRVKPPVCVCLSALVLLLGGCLLRDSRPPVLYTLALYAPVSPAQPDGGLVRTLESSRGDSVRVASIPILSSRDFPSVEKVTNADGSLALRVELDRHGRFAWMQASTERPERRLVVALEGTYHSMLPIPARPAENGYIVLPGPWSAAEAEAIVKHAPTNYERLWE